MDRKIKPYRRLQIKTPGPKFQCCTKLYLASLRSGRMGSVSGSLELQETSSEMCATPILPWPGLASCSCRLLSSIFLLTFFCFCFSFCACCLLLFLLLLLGVSSLMRSPGRKLGSAGYRLKSHSSHVGWLRVKNCRLEKERKRKRGDLNHLSVHQRLRAAIPDSQQPTSPIGFLFLKLPSPRCAVLLVLRYYIIKKYIYIYYRQTR